MYITVYLRVVGAKFVGSIPLVADIFLSHLFSKLMNDRNDMDVFLNDIDHLINDKCNCSGSCIHGTHGISVNDVKLAIGNLKYGKRDGSSDVVPEHIINICNICFNVHIAILFSILLRHGVSLDGMLQGSMVPIPDDGLICNILCKLFDVIILIKENNNLVTSNL